ncbi:MAG: ActS/PrrB/RegB family redox-sensitive histidine kinase [Alphaproteobacteria bacterium]|nr:ActS/PrrB/RegB family redox-sensitive histidine kinase [Alphaproteobacteria bacterium]
MSIAAEPDSAAPRRPAERPPADRAPSTGSAWTSEGRVRLRTLVLLRWLAIGGQSGAALFVQLVLGFDVPLGAALAVIATSAWLNLFLMIALPSQRLVKEWEAALQLAYDVVQLAVLLALTGGIENPFLLLFIAPVAVSAAVLRPSTTAGLAALAYVCVGALALWHWPLPWYPGQALDLPPLYQAGLAAAVLIGLGFTSVYAWRVAAEEERLNIALAAVQAVLAREQRLAALGGLAAAAAHELGTPLATIHLVAKEMARGLPADSPLQEDVQLLVSQSERCRTILKQLSSQPETRDVVHERMPLRALVEESIGAHHAKGKTIEIRIGAGDAVPEGAPPPDVRRSPEILHGLGNLVENAVDFAESMVVVTATWTPVEIEITVCDDGPGFAPNVLPRLGEPYVSERSAGQTGGGLGLGFFIAKTLLERSGARVEFQNATTGGALVRSIWPRRAIEARPLTG